MDKPQTVTLRDLLTDAQAKRVIKIVNSTPSTIERVAKLKEYFISIEKSINRKSIAKFGNTGIDPGWLAYAVEAVACQQTSRAQPNN